MKIIDILIMVIAAGLYCSLLIAAAFINSTPWLDLPSKIAIVGCLFFINISVTYWIIDKRDEIKLKQQEVDDAFKEEIDNFLEDK